MRILVPEKYQGANPCYWGTRCILESPVPEIDILFLLSFQDIKIPGVIGMEEVMEVFSHLCQQ